MKATVSLPDEIFQAAEDLAEQLGLSRSDLYARAIAELLARHRDEDVTDRLNAVYRGLHSDLDPVLEELQFRSLSRNDW